MAKLFTNYSTEDFTHSWDGIAQTFAAGKTVPFSNDAIANHFAKHFVNLRMIRDGKDAELMNETTRASYLEKCLKDVELPSMPGLSEEARMFEALKEQARTEARAELLSEQSEEPTEKPARKPRAKKEEIKAVKVKTEEETFEGLDA